MNPQELNDWLATARNWLQEQAPDYSGKARQGLTMDEDLALGRRWQALKSDAGYACITLPRQYGGGGGTEMQKILFEAEEKTWDLPNTYFGISLGMPVPMLLRYGSEAVKDELLPKAIRGEHIWCQLFSEPAAGSDLAALTLKATRDGDGWRLNGQKLWTSWAQYSDWGIIVTRSDPTVPKHAGLTYFYLDMKSEGVEVRTIRKLAGESEINEVFFNNVYVPDSQRMGEVGGGFKVAIETLMVERYAVSDEACGGISAERFIDIAARARIGSRPALEDGEVRRLLSDTLVERQGLRSIHRRAMEAIAAGHEPGPEGAIRKLLIAKRRLLLGAAAMDLMGPDALLYDSSAAQSNDPVNAWIEAPPIRIAGGTDEILRNTIAEKVLRLPQDHRPDKGVPFNQL
jgi:alkylation response protein AidB-like acyl-CoA dehydrogenase